MKHIMVDLETLGSIPGCVILSLGAVEFDPTNSSLGRKLYHNIDLQSCLNAGLKIEADTFYWWLQQSEQAQYGLIDLRLPLYAVLKEFSDWLPKDAVLWSHGSSFDLALLSCAYQAVHLSKPWAFRNERDTRTVLDIAQMKMPKTENSHHAFHDAIAQANTIMEALKRLGMCHL